MRSSVVLIFLLLLSCFASAQQISGEYVESRNADVYTGYCFANSEAGLTGNTAILGWHVRKGSWNGVPLDGLTMAAAVRARATLGDPYGHPFPALSVLVVDDQADALQSAALIELAHQLGGELLANVVRVESAPVELVMPLHGAATLRAGYMATVETRPLDHGDEICGNEATYYPPLTDLTHSMPVVAVTDEYLGNDLGTKWELHGKRSAFVGTFAVPEPSAASAGTVQPALPGMLGNAVSIGKP